jgi:hypothetical protein
MKTVAIITSLVLALTYVGCCGANPSTPSVSQPPPAEQCQPFTEPPVATPLPPSPAPEPDRDGEEECPGGICLPPDAPFSFPPCSPEPTPTPAPAEPELPPESECPIPLNYRAIVIMTGVFLISLWAALRPRKD